MKQSEHPIKPPHVLNDEELALKCLENPGYTSVGFPYHLEKERRYRRFHGKVFLMAAIAAGAAVVSILVQLLNLLV